jgi:hypothetical protein
MDMDKQVRISKDGKLIKEIPLVSFDEGLDMAKHCAGELGPGRHVEYEAFDGNSYRHATVWDDGTVMEF